MAMSSTTANWHWKTKYVSGWAKTWFETNLVEVEGISRVSNVEGDVEIGQRKSKLITIYDCKVELEWKASDEEGNEATGGLVIPEVSHETTLDGVSDYQYLWTLTSAASPPIDKLYKHVKSTLPALLEEKFKQFPKALLDEHGKDLTVIPTGTPDELSRTVTPVPPSDTPASKSTTSTATSATSPAPKSTKSTKINTATVTVEGRFMASADDLFSLLTDGNRIPIWSRAPATSTAAPNSEYSLFGGGVKGTYISVEPPKKYVQTWILQSPTWPSGHSATLTVSFFQESDSTKVVLNMDGVPKGMEEEIERNIEGYYIRGLKSIGYVPVQLIERETPSPLPPNPSSIDWRGILVIAVIVLVLGMAIGPAFLGEKPAQKRK